MRTISSSIALSTRGRPGLRCFEPSNLRATSLRYHPRMVSGRAAVATSPSALRPSRRPISPSFARSAPESFGRPFLVNLKIAFLCLHPFVQLVEVRAPQRLDCLIVCAIALCTRHPKSDRSKLDLINPGRTLHFHAHLRISGATHDDLALLNPSRLHPFSDFITELGESSEDGAPLRRRRQRLSFMCSEFTDLRG